MNSASPRRVSASCLSATNLSSRRTRSETAVAAASAAATAAALAPSIVASTASGRPGPDLVPGVGEPAPEDARDDSMALAAAAAATAFRSSGGAGSVAGGSVAGGSVAGGSVAGDGGSGARAGGAAAGAGVPFFFFRFAASVVSDSSILGPGALNFLSESGTVATGSDAGAEGPVDGTGMSGAGGSVTRGGDEGIAGAGGGGGGGGGGGDSRDGGGTGRAVPGDSCFTSHDEPTAITGPTLGARGVALISVSPRLIHAPGASAIGAASAGGAARDSGAGATTYAALSRDARLVSRTSRSTSSSLCANDVPVTVPVAAAASAMCFLSRVTSASIDCNRSANPPLGGASAEPPDDTIAAATDADADGSKVRYGSIAALTSIEERGALLGDKPPATPCAAPEVASMRARIISTFRSNAAMRTASASSNSRATSP